jgi:transcriptional regulator with XRE-family HTH domain
MEKSLFTEDYQTLIRMLREVREQAGTSQVDLAARLGTTQSLISKCERNERRLDAIELRRWVMELGLPFPEFLQQFEAALKKKRTRGARPSK